MLATMTSKQLRKWLEQHELTQVGLAMRFQINPRTVRRYVNGESEIPTMFELALLGLETFLKKETRK
jgi:transcriptional regulator with XRE-family HTH domain